MVNWEDIMVECASLFERDYGTPKMMPKLEKHGLVVIHFRGNDFGSGQIYNILSNVSFVIKTYKKACKKIVFVCEGTFKPKYMLACVLFEVIIYTLIFQFGYEKDHPHSRHLAVNINLQTCALQTRPTYRYNRRDL